MTTPVLIAKPLFPSIAKLTPNEQVRAIDFITKFQANPAHPGVQLHTIEHASKGVWSGRISKELRAILYKDGSSWVLIYAGHHDPAYDWAKRRDFGRHSVTGHLQIVESVETVREVEKVIERMVEPEAPPVFQAHNDAYLLSLGVPENWLPTLRKIRTDDQFLAVSEKLPEEVGERLFSVLAGELVTPPAPLPKDKPQTEAEDVQRRFFVVEDVAGLRAALEAPLDAWIAFLHPSQRAIVKKTFNGPAKVSGSAGTGKTVVAMHRARHLAQKGERVLLTSYVTTLCENLQKNLSKLCAGEALARITVSTVHKQALGLVRQEEPRFRPAPDHDVLKYLDTLRIRHTPGYDAAFVEAEWEHVVRLQGIHDWTGYRQARRTGRGRGLSVKARKQLWKVFGGTLAALAARKELDWSGLCHKARELLEAGRVKSPFSAVIVDEVQDLKPPELRFLRALCSQKPGQLLLCGDAGQRIYPGGFSLGALGIEVRGRATILRINYRTTEQIRRTADRVLGDKEDDMDGGTESRARTRSLLRGPQPKLRGHKSRGNELQAAAAEVMRWLKSSLQPEDIGVFLRTSKGVSEFGKALSQAGIRWHRLSDKTTSAAGCVNLGTMHRAKGLEFKAVLVSDCADKVVPSSYALHKAKDPQDRETAESRERRLLYVAMTRARDELTLTWTGRPSRFLAPLLSDLEDTP